MIVNEKSGSLVVAVICWCVSTGQASAVTAEVAHACNGLVAKSFPPRQVGNPAAGSKNGDAKAQRDFFQKCVANGGKMDADPPKDSK